MNTPSRPGRRIRIDRLELDLRGIAPATADAAARALGSALADALAAQNVHIAAADRIDAGRIASPASPGAHDLARAVAGRIADTIRREDA
jgi:hypothetical protein